MTNSSTGGNGSNELRFEDKAGSEEVYPQAQQDLNIKVVKGNMGIVVATGNETSSVNLFFIPRRSGGIGCWGHNSISG